jgi:very-short-patch-repair endonuclease|tara:strand:- start:4067 stop:4834 length:768 start_codon:yes stop_codon:yes gene_type:complete
MNEEQIIKMYEKEGRSTYEIAESVGTYPNKIRRILKKHGVVLKSRSQAQQNALKGGRASHPTDGRLRTKEERIKISSSVHKHWKNMSDKEKKRRVDGARERWWGMSEAERSRISRMAIEAIQKAGKEGSKLEKFLLKELTNAGYFMEFHKKNLIPNENLEIDLYIPDLKTIIEVDGPSHFLPIWGEDKLQKQIKSDFQKTGLILGKGFVIIRLKSLGNFVSLSQKETLMVELTECLRGIENKYPQESERYVEIEL